MDDFRKYATKHLGMTSLVLDDVIKSQAGSLNPYILEERHLNVSFSLVHRLTIIPLILYRRSYCIWIR